jgi:hypothetical protein
VVGYYALPNDAQFHGFLLQQGTFTTIDAPGSTSTYTSDINNAGTIIGSRMRVELFMVSCTTMGL